MVMMNADVWNSALITNAKQKMFHDINSMLTQEYEFAKIQEAKEIPTINVLDAAILPETKSFPPGAVIVILAVFLSLAFAAAFVIAAGMWKRSESPEKQLATEIWGQIAAENEKARAMVHLAWTRFGERFATHNVGH